MKQKATNKKLDTCLEWIIEFMLDNSKPPSMSEIATGNDVSVGTARAYLREMNGRKMIELDTSGFCLGIAIPGVYYLDNR